MTRLKVHLRDGAAVGLLCLLTIACTSPIALAGRVLAGGDVFTYFYPYWAEATRAIRAARVPLWNPTLFMGVPFAANSQVGLFYPLNWLLWLLLPPHRSVHVTIALHLCLAGLTAYVWGRRSLHLGRVASWTVGAAFALGGYLGAQAEHVNQLQGLAWLPLMLVLSDDVLCSQAARPEVTSNTGSKEDDGASRALGSAASVRRRLRASCALAVVVALVVLAGHTQTAFIALFGMAVYGLLPTFWRALRGGDWGPMVGGAALLCGGVVLGVALGAVQLLPTWELSQLSVRAQGLPFNERVSFSLSPLYVGRALLPAFGRRIPPWHLEHVAYVGTVGLALAMLGLAMDHNLSPGPRYGERRSGLTTHHSACSLMLLGLFFALGLYNPLYVGLARYVPGFAHFRVPARWLALYGCGVAALSGRAVHSLWEQRPPDRHQLVVAAGSLSVLVLWAVAGTWLGETTSADGGADLLCVAGWVGAGLGSTGLLMVASKRPRLAVLLLLTLLTGELILAGRALPRARATASQAFTSVRPAVAHLLASQQVDSEPAGRLLSMSDTAFDPGDLSLIERIYGPQLSSDQLYDYVVATKQKEILSPNLPLAFDLPSVDGYDGGLLPLGRYAMLQRLLVSSEDLSFDGRLRENLTTIPEGRWLDLFNVRYIITDKLRDVWIDGVFYDLQFGARLSDGEQAQVAEVPGFDATSLGVVSCLERRSAQAPGPTPSDGAPVGVVQVSFAEGRVASYTLRAGENVPESGSDQPASQPTATRLRWAGPARPLTITVKATAPHGAWVVRGLSLIDERTGSFQPLVISDRGRFRVAHSGDVKIYENLDVLPRVFIVSRAEVVSDDEAALQAMRDPTLDLSSHVVLSGGRSSAGKAHAERIDVAEPEGTEASSSASAVATMYEPERVVVETASDHPGYLVLTDAHYPGWRAEVDGRQVPIYRADLLFRAVALGPGQHRVVFSFRPTIQRVGIAMSLAGLVVLAAVWHERRIVETAVRCYNAVHDRLLRPASRSQPMARG